MLSTGAFLLRDSVVGGIDVRHLADGDIGSLVHLVDQVLELGHLEAVDHKIDHALLGIGVSAPGLQTGGAALEGVRQDLAHLIGMGGDDHRALGPVQAVHDEVHGLEGRAVGDDGVKGQDPVLQHDAADDIEKDIKSNGFNPFVNKKTGEVKSSDFIKAVLNQSLARAYDAYNLLNFTDFKGILDNMMLLGFPASQNRVTSKLDTEVNNE